MLTVGFAGAVLAQGSVYFDSSANTSTSPSATSNGQWFLQNGGTTSLLATDVNAELFGGASASTLAPLATLLLSNSSAAGDITFFGNGSFSDQSGNPYTVAGASTTGYFQIEAWTGNFSTLAAATAGGAFTATSAVFQSPVAIAPTPAPGLSGMPAIVLTNIPEPGTFALAGLGAAALLIFRRRK
jgi:hypothetical protein